MQTDLLAGKTVVVTGGAGLLGREFCGAIAAGGGRAIVADINLAAATEVADKINIRHPQGALAVGLDITEKSSITDAFASVVARTGTINAIVNNAYPRNHNYGRKLENVEFEDFTENLSLHLGGYFLVSQQAAQLFLTLGGGTIVNMSSIYGIMAPRFSIYVDTPMTMPVEYAAIKSGVVQLTRYFAQYYKGKNIRVNAISPGGIEDGQPEAFLNAYRSHCDGKGMLDTSDLTGTLIFLLSDMSRHINGQNIVVDDGFSL